MLVRGDSRVETVSELIERVANALAGRHEIREAYLFGSCARDARQAHSDVDVAVNVDLKAVAASSFGYLAELTSTLMTCLGNNRVDVVVLNDAPPLLYHRVLKHGIRILSRDLRETTVREGRALSRFCDYVPQLAKIDAAMGVTRRTTPRTQ
jgi:predicted nucleotidyltransferase